MSNKYPTLGYLGEEAVKHWRIHRPKMYKELKKAGELEKAALNAQEQTLRMLGTLLEQGMKYNMAWEMVCEEWVYLRDERTMPKLGEILPPPDNDWETSDYWWNED